MRTTLASLSKKLDQSIAYGAHQKEIYENKITKLIEKKDFFDDKAEAAVEWAIALEDLVDRLRSAYTYLVTTSSAKLDTSSQQEEFARALQALVSFKVPMDVLDYVIQAEREEARNLPPIGCSSQPMCATDVAYEKPRSLSRVIARQHPKQDDKPSNDLAYCYTHGGQILE